MVPRQMYITGPQLRILTMMQEDEEFEGELVESDGVWYVGCERVNSGDAEALLRKVLIRGISCDGERLHRFALSEDGLKILADHYYRPRIYSYLSEKLEADFDALDQPAD